jgi:hypothetical protein
MASQPVFMQERSRLVFRGCAARRLGTVALFMAALLVSCGRGSQTASLQAVRGELQNRSLEAVKRDRAAILREAYPLAFGKLAPGEVELLGLAVIGPRYRSTVRLHYRNLLDQEQYLDIGMTYDSSGQFISWGFEHYSDVIAPRELTVGALFDGCCRAF